MSWTVHLQRTVGDGFTSTYDGGANKRAMNHYRNFDEEPAARQFAEWALLNGWTTASIERDPEPVTVKRADLFGNVADTYATEGELNGHRPTQGRMI